MSNTSEQLSAKHCE